MTDPCRLTATEAARRIREGSLSARAMMESCLDRIAARESVVRAFAYLDPVQALEAAEAAAPGALQGLPVGAKDVLDTADMPTGYGSPIWTGWRPHADASAIAWLRAAGGVVIGKTVTTEFATRLPGPTTNPHNAAHTPGGSSSGSAAGVADFFFPVAFGTQTAGSIIRPAAYCGVVGYKPSFGMIPRAGMKLMSESLDTIGAIARSVADCALFVGAVARRDLGDPNVKPGRAPRVGVCQSPVWDRASADTQALLARVAETLGRAGAVVRDLELPPDFAGLEQAHPVVMNAESARSMGWELARAREQVSGQLLERLDFGLAQTDADLDAAYGVFQRTQRAFDTVMEDLDILLTPSAPGEAPAGIGWTGDPIFNWFWTSLHVPCVTVPAGTGGSGLPLGVQVVARRGEDRQALAWAQFVAAALN